MKSALEMGLSIKDFTHYFEQQRLGKLYFPNGKCIVPRGLAFENAEFPNFFIELGELYKLVCGWRVNCTTVPIEDIVAVVAFGSAVRYPGVKDVITRRRKYLLFGQKIPVTKKVLIQPEDADFLVITGNDLIHEEVLKPISLETYDCGTWIKRGGIHLVNRGVGQIQSGIRADDTVSISALREGVLIFFNSQFGDLVAQTGIISDTPREILWDENEDGFLTGRIQ